MTSNQKELSELIYTKSLGRLQQEATLAIARDQRALVFAALAMTSAGVTLEGLSEIDAKNLGLGSALFQAVAALISALTALPQKLYAATEGLSELRDKVLRDEEIGAVYLSLAKNNDCYSKKNSDQAELIGRIFSLAVILYVIGAAITCMVLIT